MRLLTYVGEANIVLYLFYTDFRLSVADYYAVSKVSVGNLK